LGEQLTAVGVASLLPALQRPWGTDWHLEIDGFLAEAGAVALAKALPPALETLFFEGVQGVGDVGMLAIVAALPKLPRLRYLCMTEVYAVTARGWVALAGALPSLPALEMFSCRGNDNLGPQGARAIAAAVPHCPQLRVLDLENSLSFEEADPHLYYHQDSAAQALLALQRPRDHPAGELRVTLIAASDVNHENEISWQDLNWN